jgi:predicted dienelactone hydrolase
MKFESLPPKVARRALGCLLALAACGGSSGNDGSPSPTQGGHSSSSGGSSGDDGGEAGGTEAMDGSSSGAGALDAGSSGIDAASPQPDAEATGSPDGSPGPSTDGAAACSLKFPSATDFGKAGPFTVAIDCSAPTSVTADGTGCAIYHPTTMGQNGLKHPVIVWGNGTASPAECNGGSHVFGEYDYLFNQWASHGFVVAVANTASSGDGTDLLDCLNWIEQQNTVSGSIYAGVIDVGNDGASGHSQGGGSAINVGKDPRVRTTLPFMPYTVNGGFSYDPTAPTKQHGPMFLASGGMDTIATPSTNQQPVFDAATMPTFWGTLLAADHVSFAGGTQTDWLAPSTAWFRLWLMCDESARPMFYGPTCTVCTDSKWTVQRKGIQ